MNPHLPHLLHLRRVREVREVRVVFCFAIYTRTRENATNRKVISQSGPLSLHATTFSPHAYIFSREAVTFSREAVALLSLKGNEGMPNDIPSLSGSSSPSGGLLNHVLELSARACSRSKEHEQAQLFAHLITIFLPFLM